MDWRGTGEKAPPAIEHPPAAADPFDLRQAQIRVFARAKTTLHELRWSLRLRLANKSASKPRPVRHADQRRK